jgi:hypothetical protein
VLLALLVLACLLVVAALMRPVQLRVWNEFGGPDVAVMAALILPFMLLGFRGRPHQRASHWAWTLCAAMAVDVVCFALGWLGPFGGGHPSLEALISSFIGLAKPVLIPAAAILLGIGWMRGERPGFVVAGFVCLVGEALYGVYPTTWWFGS